VSGRHNPLPTLSFLARASLSQFVVPFCVMEGMMAEAEDRLLRRVPKLDEEKNAWALLFKARLRPGAFMNKWHSDIMDRYTRIYSYSKITGPILHTLICMVPLFHGSKVDKRKSNDLACVGCGHPTTSGSFTFQVPHNAQSRDKGRRYMFQKCSTVLRKLRAGRRQ